MWQRPAAVVAVCVCVGSVLTACSFTGCSGAMQTAPSVFLAADEWTSQHPGAILKARLGGGPLIVLEDGGGQAYDPGIANGSQHRFRLRVTGTRDDATILSIDRTIIIPATEHTNTACGDVTRQSISLTLGADGALRGDPQPGP